MALAPHTIIMYHGNTAVFIGKKVFPSAEEPEKVQKSSINQHLKYLWDTNPLFSVLMTHSNCTTTISPYKESE